MSQRVVFCLEYENGHVLLLCLNFAGFQQKGKGDMPKGFLKKTTLIKYYPVLNTTCKMLDCITFAW